MRVREGAGEVGGERGRRVGRQSRQRTEEQKGGPMAWENNVVLMLISITIMVADLTIHWGETRQNQNEKRKGILLQQERIGSKIFVPVQRGGMCNFYHDLWMRLCESVHGI